MSMSTAYVDDLPCQAQFPNRFHARLLISGKYSTGYCRHRTIGTFHDASSVTHFSSISITRRKKPFSNVFPPESRIKFRYLQGSAGIYFLMQFDELLISFGSNVLIKKIRESIMLLVYYTCSILPRLIARDRKEIRVNHRNISLFTSLTLKLNNIPKWSLTRNCN